MDPPQNPPQKEICKEHNLPIDFYHPNLNNNKGALCVICLQKLTGIIQGDTFQQTQQLINQLQSQNNQAKEMLVNTLNSVTEYKKSINISLDSIIKMITDQVEIIDSFIKKMKNIFDDENNQQVSLEQIKKEFDDQSQLNLLVKKQVQQKLQQYKAIFCKIDHLAPTLEIEVLKQSIEMENSSKITDLALNKDCTTLIIAREGKILVCKIKNGIINTLQELAQKYHYAVYLYFMKNSNSFVSGGGYLDLGYYVIWEFDEKKQWFVKYQLRMENSQFFSDNPKNWSIIMNEKENLLILRAQFYLKFWRKNNGWFGNDWSCEQQLEQNYNSALSMNESENKIIVDCLNHLGIMKLKKNKIWKEIQVINGEFSAACFTIGDQFVVNHQSKLEVYVYDKNLKQFSFLKEIQVNWGKMTHNNRNNFIKSKSNLASAYDFFFINIYKVDKAYNYQLIGKIQFNYDKFIISDSGEYLISWHESDDKIQVRRLKYTE